VRILSVGNLYPPHHFGGYELIWRGAVEQMRAAGHEIRILTTDYRLSATDPAVPEDPDCHRELRWYWHDHEFPRIGPLARLRIERHNADVLRRHLEGWTPDVVAWWPMGGMSMSLIEHVHRARIPAVAVVMDDWPNYGPRVDAWQAPLGGHPRRGRVVERLTGVPTLGDLGSLTRWVFISRHQLERTERVLGPLPGARVAHAGVDEELFRPAPEHEWRWRLLYCGRIDPRKGIDLAVTSLSLLPEEATLSVVGGGDREHRDELERTARELGVQDRLSFDQVERDRLPDMFAEHDVLLFPVRWEEPWGLVPLEAMAVGLLVIASGRGGSAEYFVDGENCLLADPDAGPGALAEALQRLAGDADLRRRLRSGGLRTAERYPDTAFATAVADAAAETIAAAETVPA
jgi:glycosyltransferase involved in cell wall biosynthesis